MQEGHCLRTGPFRQDCESVEKPAGRTIRTYLHERARVHPSLVYTLEYSTNRVSNYLRWPKRVVSIHVQAEGVRRRRIPSCMVAVPTFTFHVFYSRH